MKILIVALSILLMSVQAHAFVIDNTILRDTSGNALTVTSGKLDVTSKGTSVSAGTVQIGASEAESAIVLGSSTSIRSLQVYVSEDNVGEIYIGGSSVSGPSVAGRRSAQGMLVTVSNSTIRLNVDNLADVYFSGANEGDEIFYIIEIE